MPTSAPFSLDDLPDEALVRRTLDGQREAFNQLVIRHQRRLFRFLAKNAANAQDAEDAVQQALTKAYVHLAKYNSKWRFTTWLFTIALRELRSLRRKSMNAAPLDAVGEHADPSSSAERRNDNPDIWSLARRILSTQQYTTLWLRYGEDLPPRDIAKVVNRPRIWVSVTLNRACAALRKLVEQSTETVSADIESRSLRGVS